MQQAETIIAYLNRQLSGPELQRFEQQLATDADLRSAVADYRTILEGFRGMRHDHMQAQLQEWTAETGIPEEELLILAYLRNELGPEARKTVEERRDNDPEWADKIDQYQQLMQGFSGLRQEAFRREVAGWAESLPKAKPGAEARAVPIRKPPRLLWRYAAAAAAVLLAVAAWWWLFPGSEAAPDYTAFRQENYLAPAPDALERGSESTLAEATRAFLQKDYSTVIESLGQIPPDDSLFVLSRYLLGHSYYQSGQYRRSREAFTESLEPPFDDIYRLDGFSRDNAAWTRILAQLALMEDEQGAPDQTRDLEYFLTAFMEQADRSDTYYEKATALRDYLGQ